MTLQTISDSPRIFRVVNFFNDQEAEQMVINAMGGTSETHRLKRSSTGSTGYTVDQKRTSETAFDTNSPLAMTIKRRGFKLIGRSPYNEHWADGLQVLRYNLTTAYHNHMDWIAPGPNTQKDAHDYDSAKDGTNRFATILLYLTDVEKGGETVFPKVARPNPSENLSGYDEILPQEAYAWQRVMVKDCRTKLSVRPVKTEAILFYSQLNNGMADQLSLHGGCPVLEGQKWAANLWIWNGPRVGYPARPRKGMSGDSTVDTDQQYEGKEKESQPESKPLPPIEATFQSMSAGVVLYWGDKKWGAIQAGVEVKVHTYPGHVWNARSSDGTLLARWQVRTPSDEVDAAKVQRFVVPAIDVSDSHHPEEEERRG